MSKKLKAAYRTERQLSQPGLEILWKLLDNAAPRTWVPFDSALQAQRGQKRSAATPSVRKPRSPLHVKLGGSASRARLWPCRMRTVAQR